MALQKATQSAVGGHVMEAEEGLDGAEGVFAPVDGECFVADLAACHEECWFLRLCDVDGRALMKGVSVDAVSQFRSSAGRPWSPDSAVEFCAMLLVGLVRVMDSWVVFVDMIIVLLLIMPA